MLAPVQDTGQSPSVALMSKKGNENGLALSPREAPDDLHFRNHQVNYSFG